MNSGCCGGSGLTCFTVVYVVSVAEIGTIVNRKSIYPVYICWSITRINAFFACGAITNSNRQCMNKNFADRLKQSRQELNRKQTEMALKVGVTSSAWSRWESGKGQPDLEKLYLIGSLFGLSLDYLILGIDTRSPLTVRLLLLVASLSNRELVKVIELLEVFKG